MERGYKYLGFSLLLLVPLTVIGFLKSYLGDFPRFVNAPGFAIHFHFCISAIWILMFILQPFLVYYRRLDLHRKIGRCSYLFFILLLGSFIPLYLIQIDGGFVPLIVLTTSDILVLIFLYALAIFYKKRPTDHMRYMISLIFVFALPSIGRINSRWFDFSFIQNMNIGFALVFIVLGGLAFRDILAKRNYRPYLIALVAFFIRQLAIYIAYFFS